MPPQVFPRSSPAAFPHHPYIPNNPVYTNLFQDFAEGTNGTTLTTGINGNTSASGEDFFNLLTIGTSASVQFSNATGPIMMAVATGATSSAACAGWSTSIGLQGIHWGRIYINLTAAATSSDAFIQFQSSGSTFAGGIQLTTLPTLTIQDAAFSFVHTFATTLSLSTRYRIEWFLRSNGAGASQIIVSLFLGDSTTALETYTGPTNANYGPNNAATLYGWTGGHINQPTTYIGNVAYSTFGPLGPAIVPTTSVGLADAGSATDALTTVATVSLSDSGSGSDVLSETITAPLSDSGVGSDILSVSVSAGLADAGAGSDVLNVSVSAPLTDSGAGSDVIAVAIPTALSDSGAGTDTLSVTVSVSLADSGLGTDAFSDSVSAPLVDAGAGSDALTLSAAVGLSDSGAGSSALSVTASVSLSDTGAGSDALSATVTTSLVDSAVGSDTVAATVSAPLLDAGVGSDTLSVTVSLGISDAGTAVDAITALVAAPLADSGSGSDALAVVVGAFPVALADAGSGADALTATVSLSLTDSGSGTDTLVLSSSVLLADAGLGTDAASVIVSAPLADSGTGIDHISIVQPTALTDAGAGADSLAISVPASLTDSGQGSDALSVSVSVPLSDSGHGSDQIEIAVPLGDSNFSDAAVNAIFDKIVSHALASGRFDGVNSHEPKNAPGNGVYAAAWLDRIVPLAVSGLGSTTGKVIINLRIYTSFVPESFDTTDLFMAAAAADVITDLTGDFDFGAVANVRNVDILGDFGDALEAIAGYTEIDKRVFRTMTLSVPVIINDMFSQFTPLPAVNMSQPTGFNDAAISFVFDKIVSLALASARFDSVNQHEPKSAPGNGISCSIWMQSIKPTRSSGLAATSGCLTIQARVYSSFVQQPFDAIDPNVTAGAAALVAALSADFDFDQGQGVRNVDLLGATGDALGIQAGYIEIDHRMFRVMTVNIPIIMNDMFVQTA